MNIEKINIKAKANLINVLDSYKIIAEMNDYYFKLVKEKREFVWHKHPETDEVFITIEGKFKLAFRDKVSELDEGDMVVVPKGVEHKSIFEDVCCVMLIEPKTTINTGDAEGNLTETELEWI
ncbi:MAG: cupin domain-containing protein [Spirochaetes bacterium]|nr:cupin domain-containing protein [Spirochaetota bacterium]MBN2771472.1 cupin domain-containing protein [Spirochaetota bacterium]